jgi:ubiquinone/menaquinone biosynthesis C-methylase UbiE
MEDREYYHKRESKKSFRYRLERRASEVYNCIVRHRGRKSLRVLDLGTADGSMISQLAKELPDSTFFGIDLSPYLLLRAKEKGFTVVCSDICRLPFKKGTFDVVTGTAVIEHLDSIERAMEEVVRVLKSSGLCVFTTPNPLHDALISALVPWYGKGHTQRVSLRRLKQIFLGYNLIPLTAERFLLLPFKVPGENFIEKLFKKAGLGVLLFNQVIAGQPR